MRQISSYLIIIVSIFCMSAINANAQSKKETDQLIREKVLK
jgi:hypothetical protein